MTQRTRSIRARVSPSEHRKLTKMADRAGVTQSEFVRILISREQDESRIEAAVEDVTNLIKEIADQGQSSGCEQEFLVEVLLIIRELAADKNTQFLTSANLKLDQLFGKERSKL